MPTEVPPVDGTCGERVGQGTVTFPCSLSKGHVGPHYAIENSASRNRRARWEQEQAFAKTTLAEFQGYPRTTAESLTINPTEMPQSEAVLRAEAAAARAQQDEYLRRVQAEQAAHPLVSVPVEVDLPIGVAIVDGWTSPTVAGSDEDGNVPASRGTATEPMEWYPGLNIDFADHVHKVGVCLTNRFGERCSSTRIKGMEDGLTVIYRTDRYVLKELPDGSLMVEDPTGQMGERIVMPSYIDVPEEQRVAFFDGLSTAQRLMGVTDEPTKQREGDQALPVSNEHIDSYEALIADLRQRREVGVNRYGVALQPFNMRNTVQDAYEESMDLAVYLRTVLTMREASRADLVQVVQRVLVPMTSSLTIGSNMADKMAQEYAGQVVDALLDAAIAGR